MTEATIDAAETALFQAKVPASEPKYLVVDSQPPIRRFARSPVSANTIRRAKRACERWWKAMSAR